MNTEDCIFFMISKANQNSQKFWLSYISKYNITSVQGMVLNFLRGNSDMSIQDICKKAGIDNATMTGVMDRLEALGLIIKNPDVTDRRAYKILLTSKGIELTEEIHNELIEANKKFLEGIPKKDQKLLKELLIKIREIKKK